MKEFTPVALPPGRLRLATRPSLTGSSVTLKTMGVPLLAAIAARCMFIGPSDDDRCPSSDEISGQLGEAVVLPLSIAILDCYVLVFDVAHFGQGSEKCRQIWRHRSGRPGMKKPDHRHRWLLRATP